MLSTYYVWCIYSNALQANFIMEANNGLVCALTRLQSSPFSRTIEAIKLSGFMHCTCLVSLDKQDQICGWTIVDWFSSSNANLELPETCMFCIDGCDWWAVLLGRNTDSRNSNYSVYG